MTLQGKLKAVGACKEAIEWAKGREWPTAWQECERGDWMLWLGGMMEGKKGWPTREDIVLVACDCAELALPTYEKEYPKDSRVRDCIETTRKWIKGEATIEDVRKARAAADDASASWAADAAYAAAAAASASWAADASASWAADAAYAAAAAASASWAAEAAAARQVTLKQCAEFCMKQLTVPKKW